MIVSQYYNYLPWRRKQQKRVFVSVAMILHNIITGTLEVDAQSGVDHWSVSTAPAEIIMSSLNKR